MRFILLNFPALYITVVVLAYLLGPWGLADSVPIFNYYLVLVILSIVLGGFLGRRVALPLLSPTKISSGDKLFKYGLMASFFLIFPTTFARTGSFFPDILFGLTDPGAAYQRALEPAFPQIEYLRIILSPLIFCTLPLGVMYFSRLNIWFKVAFLVYVVLYSALFVAMGVNRGVFDVVFGLLFAYATSKTQEGDKLNRALINAILLTTPALIGALILFINGQLDRSGSGAGIGYFLAADSFSSLDPTGASSTLEMYAVVLVNQLTIYLTQGFYGASLIFEKGIGQLTYGFGHSDFLLRNAAKFFGEDILSLSPIYEMESTNGWDHGNFWFSIIAWIASDVGFIGAIFVIFGLSFVYSRSLEIYLKSGDWMSFLVVCVVSFIFLYFPANNYMMQSGELFVPAYLFIIIWLIKFLKRKN